MARPFFKWVGGKRALAPKLEALLPPLPSLFTDVRIPFLGGGGFVLHLLQSGRVAPGATVWLNDRNSALIDAWRAVLLRPAELCDRVRAWPVTETAFKQVRKEHNHGSTDSFVTRGARLVYLTRTSFNGLWRENRAGDMNAPWGKVPLHRLVMSDEQAENVHALSALLRQFRVRLTSCDGVQVVACGGPGVFIYCDPPYRPVTESASFTQYSRSGFNDAQQIRLAYELRAAGRRGALGMLSNSWSAMQIIEQAGLHLHRVDARRTINRDASQRGAVPELVATTYEVRQS